MSDVVISKPMPQKSIFEEYTKTNKHHKGIYGLYLYYCYLLRVFPKKQPKQYLPYSIRKEVYKLEQTSQQVRFMYEKNIVTKEDLDDFVIDGRGGTDFSIAVNSFSKKASIKIIFTDGCSEMPKDSSDVIWVVYSNLKINPPGGKVFHVDPNTLTLKGKSR